MSVVSRETFPKAILELSEHKALAVDTETTGLYPYKDSYLFSIAIASGSSSWYFNFAEYENYPADLILDKTHLELLQKELFNDPNRRWFMFNAKFDMAFLAKAGISCVGRVYDTRSIYRIIDNEAFIKFSLENCAKSIGLEKSNEVEEFITENELWDWVEIPGKKTRETHKYFDKVPLDIISKYAEIDASITYKLGMWQLHKMQDLETRAKHLKEPSYLPLLQNEIKLTKTVFEMERRGVQLDINYCKRAVEFFIGKLEVISSEFLKLTGMEFKDSEKTFLSIFKDEQIHYGDPSEKTGKVTACFDNEVLKTYKNPVAKVVLDYREAKSNLDFFQGFLFFADADGRLHASFDQDGTVTGRFGSRRPNLQNLTKDTEESLKEEFVIRRAIVPDQDFFFAMFDYDQVEYRLVLDEIESRGIINKILGGLDVHQATAELAGVDRSTAKAVNFGTLYGQGLNSLSEKLKCSRDKAEQLQNAIFKASPELSPFIFKQKNQAEKAGYIVNWFGRRCYFPNSKLAYKAINSWSQGGCADIIKIAMNRIEDFLSDKKSKMLMTVHDELVIQVHESEKHILHYIKKIMEEAYPHKLLPLTVGLDYSYKSLADRIEGFPE